LIEIFIGIQINYVQIFSAITIEFFNLTLPNYIFPFQLVALFSSWAAAILKFEARGRRSHGQVGAGAGRAGRRGRRAGRRARR